MLRGSISKLAAVLALLAMLLGTLAWYEVVPGGWTLRGWILPHAVRQAQEQAQRSRTRLALFATENPSVAPHSIVFLGSSTIERFPLPVLFPDRPVLNRGIGNETATELLRRLDASLPAADPAAAVLYVGSLDFRRERCTPETTRRRVARIVDGLRGRYPDLPIALIGLLSEWDFPTDRVEALAETNRALADLARDAGLTFIRTDRPPITNRSGHLDRASSVDRLHLGPEGYRHLARWLIEAGGPLGTLLGGTERTKKGT
ncbi:MAG: lysophospholipase L1-like esterase [Chlamydiales bacterium]|jgi:lysophospholipase L1-like esterase